MPLSIAVTRLFGQVWVSATANHILQSWINSFLNNFDIQKYWTYKLWLHFHRLQSFSRHIHNVHSTCQILHHILLTILFWDFNLDQRIFWQAMLQIIWISRPGCNKHPPVGSPFTIFSFSSRTRHWIQSIAETVGIKSTHIEIKTAENIIFIIYWFYYY